MRIFRGLIPVLPAALLFFAFNGHAQIGFEAHGLSAFDFDGAAAAFGDHRVGSGPGGGASFFFAFIPAFRVEAGADWIETEDRDLAGSRIRIVPLTAAVRAGHNFGGLYLYLGGGAGYAVNDLSPSREAARQYGESGFYELGLSNVPVYFALAGAELVLSENFGLRLEYRYNWLRADITYQDWRGFENKEKFNLDHQQVRAGLAVYF